MRESSYRLQRANILRLRPLRCKILFKNHNKHVSFELVVLNEIKEILHRFKLRKVRVLNWHAIRTTCISNGCDLAIFHGDPAAQNRRCTKAYSRELELVICETQSSPAVTHLGSRLRILDAHAIESPGLTPTNSCEIHQSEIRNFRIDGQVILPNL